MTGDDTTTTLVAALRAEVGDVVDDPAILESYRHDHAAFAAHARPEVVVRARSTTEVQATLRLASRLGIPVVPRGAGAGLAGGCNAIAGCIVLSLERMTDILEVHEQDRIAVVEPGIFNLDLKDALAPAGLWYPPDPASMAFCSIGGNVNTNAGGLCCVKYGVTRDWVQALEVVLADGRVIRTGGRSRKDVAGYDLTGLMVGSEGTLGVVTEVTLRLTALPPPASTLAAFFPSLDAAGAAIDAVCRAVTPSLLEIMDQASVIAVDEWRNVGLDRDAAALLLAQSDASSLEERRREVTAIQQACEDAGASYVAVTDDPAEGEQFLVARRLAYPALERLGTALLDDVGVPRSRLVSYLARVPAIADRYGVPISTFGHAGDGNLHPTIVYDGLDADASARARDAFDALLQVALDLGGTLTGEHGIGALKQAALEDQVGGDVLDVYADIKRALDPAGILNPGKAFIARR